MSPKGRLYLLRLLEHGDQGRAAREASTLAGRRLRRSLRQACPGQAWTMAIGVAPWFYEAVVSAPGEGKRQ